MVFDAKTNADIQQKVTKSTYISRRVLNYSNFPSLMDDQFIGLQNDDKRPTNPRIQTPQDKNNKNIKINLKNIDLQSKSVIKAFKGVKSSFQGMQTELEKLDDNLEKNYGNNSCEIDSDIHMNDLDKQLENVNILNDKYEGLNRNFSQIKSNIASSSTEKNSKKTKNSKSNSVRIRPKKMSIFSQNQDKPNLLDKLAYDCTYKSFHSRKSCVQTSTHSSTVCLSYNDKSHNQESIDHSVDPQCGKTKHTNKRLIKNKYQNVNGVVFRYDNRIIKRHSERSLFRDMHFQDKKY